MQSNFNPNSGTYTLKLTEEEFCFITGLFGSMSHVTEENTPIVFRNIDKFTMYLQMEYLIGFNSGQDASAAVSRLIRNGLFMANAD